MSLFVRVRAWFFGAQEVAPEPRRDEIDPRTARVWWLLDPNHPHHCEGCKRRAAASPYGAPGGGFNELWFAPGDGETECGPDCTCTLSYRPPPARPQRLKRDELSEMQSFLQVYTHRQIWWLEIKGELPDPYGDRRSWPRNVPEATRHP